MSLEWVGLDAMSRAMQAYGDAVTKAVKAVADYWVPIIESYAKQHAPWADQTANARQSLHAWATEMAEETVELYLSHGVLYGVWLEVRWAGKYAIIWPTLEAHIPQIHEMLQGIFS